MTNFLKSKTAKAAVGLIALVLFFGSFASNAFAAFGDHTLRAKSSWKEEVKVLQAGLNEKGFASPALVVDGAFGAKTTTAVKAYQAANGLKADGIFGPMSYSKWGTTTGGGNTDTGALCPNGNTIASNCSLPPGSSNQTGPVTVSLSPASPSSSQIVVADQATAELARFVFTGNGVVTSVTLNKGGVSSNDTLENVYLYEGGSRLTEPSSVTNTGAIQFSNPAGLFTVSGTKSISVLADIKTGTSGQTVKVTLTGLTTAAGSTTAQVEGNTLAIANATDLASAILQSSQTVGGTPSVDAGTANYTIWGNTLQISQRSVWLKGANFRVIGSAETGALTNARLVIDGVQAGNAVASVMTNGTLSFDLSAAPVTLTSGSHTIEVRADVTGGANRNFYVSLQNAGDLMVTDSQYIVNLKLKSPGSPSPVAYSMSNGGNSGTITINPGTIAFTKDTTFNTSNTITSGASNVTIAKYNLKSYGEAVKVMQLTVRVQLGTGTTGLQNVGIYMNGAQIGSSQNTPDQDETLTFNPGSALIIPAGQTVSLEVRADLQNSSGTNYSGTVTTTTTIPQSQAQGMSSYALYPTSGSLTTASTVVTAGSVSATFAKSASYVNQTVAVNTANQKIGSFIMQAGTSEGVRVTSLSVSLAGTITTTFVDAGSATLTGTGAGMTVNVASTAGMNVGDSVVVETGATDFAGTVTSVVDGDTLTVTGTTAGSTDPSADGALVTVTPASMTYIANNLTNLRLSVNGTQTAPVNPQASNNNFNVDFTVAPNTTATVDVYADAGSRSGTVVATVTPTARGASSQTAITDFDPVTGGNQTAIAGQTITFGSGTLGAGSIINVTTAASHYVLGGSSTEQIIRYNFTSSNGSSTIDELWFTIGGTAGAITKLTVAGSNGGTCTADVTGTTVHLTGCAIVVPQGFGGADLTVTPTYNTVGYGGITAGGTATVDLTDVKSTSGGVQTGQTAVSLATSNAMTLVATLPTITLAAPGTLLTAGEVKLGSVTIAAGVGGNIKVNVIPVRVVLSGGATIATTAGADDIIIREGGTTITSTDGVSGVATPTSQDFTVTLTGTEIVTAGKSRTFDIFAKTIAGVSGDDAAQLSLAPSSAFSFNDINGGGTNLVGNLILNYPTSSVTIQD